MMDKKGFTLIELVVVLVIIGILLGIAGISGKAWLDRYRVESQMKTMSVDLENARASAMQKSRTYFVVLAGSGAQYTIYEDRNPLSAGADGDGVLQQATDRQIVQKSLNSSYALTVPAEAVDSINFDSKGFASVAPGPMATWTQTTIRVAASFGAAYDCIVISATRVGMGVWNGTNCAVQ